MGFADRMRFTYDEAVKLKKEPTNKISHLVKNDDETYSLVYHINCEWCDYCEEGEANEPHAAKEDIYATVER